MDELEHDIRTWTDKATAATDPVTADEVMALGRRPGAKRFRHRIALVCGALSLAVVLIAVLVVSRPDRTATVTSGGRADAPPSISSVPPPPGETRHDQGTYKGTSTYDLWTERCTVDGVADYQLTLEAGPTWRIHNPSCGEISSDKIFTGVGTFVLTVTDGTTLTGTSYTRVPLADNGGPIDLTITGGTGALTGSAGSCILENSLVQPYIGKQFHSGTFTCDITTLINATSVPPTTSSEVTTTEPATTTTAPAVECTADPDTPAAVTNTRRLESTVSEPPRTYSPPPSSTPHAIEADAALRAAVEVTGDPHRPVEAVLAAMAWVGEPTRLVWLLESTQALVSLGGRLRDSDTPPTTAAPPTCTSTMAIVDAITGENIAVITGTPAP
jgi:hypothetical protein